MNDLKTQLSGKFIVIDGPDGAGKSTQVNLLGESLGKIGVEICTVRDPGGTGIGDRIREILLDRDNSEMSVTCEMLLYMASRAQLVSQVIKPALDRGMCVLSDRFISSTVAYQGAGGADAHTIQTVGMIAAGNAMPDLTIILDLPSDEGLDRSKRRGAPDRMESKAGEFHQLVREMFLLQASENPQKFAVVDGLGDVDIVAQRIMKVLQAQACT